MPPYAFTEHGAVMLASVLQSKVAVEASIQVVRAFVRLRSILAAHKILARKIAEMEKNYDKSFAAVFAALRQLMMPPAEPDDRPPIGFTVSGKTKIKPKRKGEIKKAGHDALLHGDPSNYPCKEPNLAAVRTPAKIRFRKTSGSRKFGPLRIRIPSIGGFTK